MNEPVMIESASEDEYFGNFLLIYQNTSDHIDAVLQRFWYLMEYDLPNVDDAIRRNNYMRAKQKFLMKSINKALLESKIESFFMRFDSSKYGSQNCFRSLKKAFYELTIDVESVFILEENWNEFTAIMSTARGYVCISWMDPA